MEVPLDVIYYYFFLDYFQDYLFITSFQHFYYNLPLCNFSLYLSFLGFADLFRCTGLFFT